MKDRDAMQKLVDEKPAGTKVELLYSPDQNGRIVLAQSMLSKNSPVLKIIESGGICFVVVWCCSWDHESAKLNQSDPDSRIESKLP